MLIKGGRLANSIILYWLWLLAVRLTFVARPSSTSGTCIFLDTNQSGLTMKLPATPMVGRGSKPVKSGLYATLDEPPPPYKTIQPWQMPAQLRKQASCHAPGPGGRFPTEKDSLNASGLQVMWDGAVMGHFLRWKEDAL